MSFQIPTSIFSQEGGESTTAELCNSSETAGILPSALEAHLSATCQLNEGRALKKTALEGREDVRKEPATGGGHDLTEVREPISRAD